MAVSKKIREIVYNKYNKRCGYTGKELVKNWQVDHITPKKSFIWHQSEKTRKKVWNVNYKVNDVENLMPALYIVNHYKRALDLEGFRIYLSEFHVRLRKVPKNPRTEKRQKYKKYMLKVAEAFDITIKHPFDGTFYFESINVL